LPVLSLATDERDEHQGQQDARPASETSNS
jgi:hypothetical protein